MSVCCCVVLCGVCVCVCVYLLFWLQGSHSMDMKVICWFSVDMEKECGFCLVLCHCCPVSRFVWFQDLILAGLLDVRGCVGVLVC